MGDWKGQGWSRGDRAGYPLSRHIMGGGFLALVLAVLFVLPTFLLEILLRDVLHLHLSLLSKTLLSTVWLFAMFHLVKHANIRYRKKHNKGMYIDPQKSFDEVMDALDRISTGDYNVNLETENVFRYRELADKVNLVANNLSSMEQMRQEFISNVSHEIQSPLTSISGFAALLKKNDLSPEKRRHYLAVIEAESKRMSQMSENLLRLSDLDAEQLSGSRREFRLDKQINSVLLMLEPQWAEKNLELDIAMDGVSYNGDEELLSQVWTNLLHNAIKFTPEGGGITVRLGRDSGGIRCSIADTGKGIPEDMLGRIFERFYKVDKSRDRSLGGNGLGLSLVKKIVDMHGGRVSVKSKLDEGSEFVVVLPD